MSGLSNRLVGRLAGLLLIGGATATLVYMLLPTPTMLNRTGLIAVVASGIALGLFCLAAPWDRWRRSWALGLAPTAFALIAAGNYFGTSQAWTFGVFFIVVFTWVGIAFRRWMSLALGPLAAVAYVVPIALRPDTDPSGATSVVITIPVAVLVGEALAWLRDRERRSRERAEGLARVAMTLSAQLEEQELLQTLVDETRLLLRAEHAVLHQLDPDSYVVRRTYTSAVGEPFLGLLRGLRGTSLDGFSALRAAMVAADRPISVPDAQESDLLPPDMIRRARVRSYLLISVRARGSLVGILSVGETSRRRPYTADDLDLAEAIAGQAATAMQNALLYRQTLDASRRDPLTELGNRRSFHERLDMELERSRRYRRPLSLVLLDADNFKAVNDTWGHVAGDRTLARLARLLDSSLRQGDGAYRVGGDEFALILPETGPEGSASLSERVRRAVARAHLGPGESFPLTVSVGVSCFPEHGSSADQLYSRADTVLYEVKHAGGDAVAVPPTKAKEGPGIRFGIDLRELVEHGRLEPIYQPIVDLTTGDVLGYEGFARLEPALGTTPTHTLFRIAGTLGLTADLDEVCRRIAIQGAGHLPEGACLFLNVSPNVLESTHFSVDRLLDALDGSAIDLDRLVIEVTEEQRSVHSKALARNLRECRDAGLKIALDDLGAGGSDLDLLGHLPFDYVKVDMVFVHGVVEERRRRLLQGLQLLVAETGSIAIAEGVETPGDLDLVMDIGFKAAQGFLLGHPATTFRIPPIPERIRSA